MNLKQKNLSSNFKNADNIFQEFFSQIIQKNHTIGLSQFSIIHMQTLILNIIYNFLHIF
ncbi:hypothetical protein pb186bvf_002110 [Paramecium bursaria]